MFLSYPDYQPGFRLIEFASFKFKRWHKCITEMKSLGPAKVRKLL